MNRSTTETGRRRDEGRNPARVRSRIPGFYALGVAARRRLLAPLLRSADGHREPFGGVPDLSIEVADTMVENVVSTLALPFGVALNFRINDRDYIVPMVVEEPSVIAAASRAALIARAGGGFTAEADPGVMIGQIQLLDVPDTRRVAARLAAAREHLLAAARALTPGLCRRGAGPREIEARVLATAAGEMVVVHVLVDTGDAMGANAVNSLVEGLAPLVSQAVGGSVGIRILSNLADRRLARARVRLPFGALATDPGEGADVAVRLVSAYEFAAADPYRAATHNKGVMNGIDAVALATGNDWRAIEAGAHAHVGRGASYRPMTEWGIDDGVLVGAIELPMAVSTVGPVARLNPRVALALRLLGVSSARELALVMVSVGLASNLAAMLALVTVGIQQGHMALHARAVSRAAGARGAHADAVRRQLIALGDVKLTRAQELLRAGRGASSAPALPGRAR